MLPTTLNLLSKKNGKQIWARIDQRFEEGRMFLKFGWDPYLLEEIKCLNGRKWHPETKEWSAPDNRRNQIALKYMQGLNPYKLKTVEEVLGKPLNTFGRPVYSHQLAMARFQIGLRSCLNIGEPGTGKTLACITAIENIYHSVSWTDQPPVWYISPKNALEASKYDFAKWQCNIRPIWLTYEAMKKSVDQKLSEKQVPFIIVFDEISRLRNAESQRSKAAEALVNASRLIWEERKDPLINGQPNVPFVWGLTGTPAPKDPTNWYQLCELTNPGFLREGNHWMFRDRLAYTRKENGIAGQTFTKVISWKDSDKKCGICGSFEDTFQHNPANKVDGHQFVPGKNEVYGLYGRLKNIALFTFKKDCLELPEKIFRIVKCKPTPATLQLAQIIKKTADRAITALINLRELSDGFMYTKDEQEVEHEECLGSGCDLCLNGKIKKQIDGLVEYPCPKDDALIDLLEDFEDRIVIFAAFTESLNKICRVVSGVNWDYIRIDGGKWLYNGQPMNPQEALAKFDKRDENGHLEGRIAIIANPKSAGLGLNFTASDTGIFYSNDFDAEARMQAIDRFHRPGSRGCNIIDLIHLPTDIKVIDMLNKKQDLQSLTMGDISLVEDER